MTARKVPGTHIDPTLPHTDIVLGGKTYSLCFDLSALAEAEDAFIRAGRQVNLLAALPNLNLSNVRIIFAAAIRKFHPEIGYEAAVKMVTLGNVYAIANTIAEAWKAAVPESEAVPTEAVAE